MKKYLTIALVSLVGVSNAQKVTVTDTLRMDLKVKPNQYGLDKELDNLKSNGWRLLTADRAGDIYIWKFEKTLTHRKRED